MIDFYQTSLACDRCEASSWERIGEFVTHRGKRLDVLECVFCGLRMRAEAAVVPKTLDQPADAAEFRFQYGRFRGMTLAEADAEPNGRRYLEVHAAKDSKVSARVIEYLRGAR